MPCQFALEWQRMIKPGGKLEGWNRVLSLRITYGPKLVWYHNVIGPVNLIGLILWWCYPCLWYQSGRWLEMESGWKGWGVIKNWSELENEMIVFFLFFFCLIDFFQFYLFMIISFFFKSSSLAQRKTLEWKASEMRGHRKFKLGSRSSTSSHREQWRSFSSPPTDRQKNHCRSGAWRTCGEASSSTLNKK